MNKNKSIPDKKLGWVFTIGLIITVIFIFFFFGFVRDHISRDSFTQSDLRTINFVQGFSSSGLDNIMLAITYLGEWQIVFLEVLTVGTALVLLRRWHYMLALIASVGGGEIFVWLTKHLFSRPRPPFLNHLTPETGFSFPSGHSFVALSFYGLLVYFLLRSTKNNFLRMAAVAAGVFVVLAVGFSRIYLGAHWPSDVLASYAVGAVWLTFFIMALETRRN